MKCIKISNINEDTTNKIEKVIKEIDPTIIIINEEEEIEVISDDVIKIKIKDINYINIEDRRITYQLTNKEIIQSKTIQSSFREEISFLDKKDYMKYAAQAILVNILNIKSIDKRDCTIKFYNGETVRIPKVRVEEIYNIWIK